MNSENLKKSYMLIGPSGVGKSLISKELSKKTGYPILSIDEILEFSKDELRFSAPKILLNKKSLLRFYKQYAKSYNYTYKKGSELEKKQNEMLKEFTDLFFFYKKILNNFKDVQKEYFNFGCLTEKYRCAFSAPISVYIIESLVVNIYKIIISKIDEPVIFDMPCNFGWFLPKDDKFKENNIDYKAFNKEMSNILDSVGTSILVEPGQDFEYRNPAKKTFYFEYLLNNIKNYKKSDIIISSNSFFYDPKDIMLANRSMFDAKSQLKREELLNKGELSNICDQIIEMANELSLQKQK